MRIYVKNPQHQSLFRIEVDSRRPPAKVRLTNLPQPDPGTPGAAGTSATSGTPANAPGNAPAPSAGAGGEIYLDWDQTIDDQGSLRKCPVCGCRDLYVRKSYPQVTSFVVVALAAVVAMALLNLSLTVAVVVLAAMIGADAAIFFFTPRKLVCYRCRSEYHHLPIRKDQHSWNSTTAQRYG